VEAPPDVDFLKLFIPINIFDSLAQNVVPAIVVFCICIGAALMGIKNKGPMLDVFDAFAIALMRVNGFVVKLTPYGVFAITAAVAGTMTVGELGRLQGYLVVLTVGTLYLTFWVLPMLVAALTPFSYREVMRVSKDALVTAFATGKTLIVLPMLIDGTKQLFEKIDTDQDAVSHSVDVMYPLAYPFPSIGKVLVLFFVPFAAWFVGAEMSLWQYPSFLVLGLFSLFGGPMVAVPFLLDFQRLPADMFQLFLAPGVYTSRLADLASAMHLVAIAVLVTAAGAGVLRVHWGKLLRLLVTSLGIGVVCVVGTRTYLAATQDDGRGAVPIIDRMDLAMRREQAIQPYRVLEAAAENPQPRREGQTQLEHIRERGVLRVGYRPGNLPWSFTNVRGELVGYDVDMAHRLATDLGVTLEFVPFTRASLAGDLAEDRFDIAMSGLVGVLGLAETVRLTAPYLEVHVALLVPDHRRREFDSREAIRAQKHIRLAVAADDPFVRRIALLYPNIELVIGASTEDFVSGRVQADAMLVSAEGGASWTLRHPSFSIVTPTKRPIGFPLVYAIARDADTFDQFLGRWLDLQRRDATLDLLYDHWILGVTAEPKQPRWSVIRDVLHWVD
jgi:ABC-type amino acid transport substrate-binding protein